VLPRCRLCVPCHLQGVCARSSGQTSRTLVSRGRKAHSLCPRGPPRRWRCGWRSRPSTGPGAATTTCRAAPATSRRLRRVHPAQAHRGTENNLALLKAFWICLTATARTALRPRRRPLPPVPPNTSFLHGRLICRAVAHGLTHSSDSRMAVMMTGTGRGSDFDDDTLTMHTSTTF